MVIERSSSADPHHSLESTLGEVNEEDLPQTKDLNEGDKRSDPGTRKLRGIGDEQ